MICSYDDECGCEEEDGGGQRQNGKVNGTRRRETEGREKETKKKKRGEPDLQRCLTRALNFVLFQPNSSDSTRWFVSLMFL